MNIHASINHAPRDCVCLGPVAPSHPRSPLWIVVLALACEEPMHPYRMQTLIKQRGKDLIANVAQSNSVYQTIDALRRAGLIMVRETSREERRPERTVYEATEEGRKALRDWIRQGLSTVAREFPEFPAALATPYGLGTDDLAVLLEQRAKTLEERLVGLEQEVPGLPRIFMLDNEYLAAVGRAEIKWLRDIIADVRLGRIRFPTRQEMLRLARDMHGPSSEAVERLARESRPDSDPKGGAAAPSRQRMKKRRAG